MDQSVCSCQDEDILSLIASIARSLDSRISFTTGNDSLALGVATTWV